MELPSSWMRYITMGNVKEQASIRSWLEAELMRVSDSPPAWRASVRHHKAISLFINLLWGGGVAMNFIWGTARAPKGLCLHLFIFPSNPPLFCFNLCITQKLIRTVNTTTFSCCYICSFTCKLRNPRGSSRFWSRLIVFDKQFTPNILL